MTKKSTNSNACILSDFRADNCEGCDRLCPHRIALHGLQGDGGRIANTNMPKDYRNVTLTNSPAREGQAKIYELLNRYVVTFTGTDRVKSLYLWSENPGTGKTTTATALINAWIARYYLTSLKNGKQPQQRPAYFLDVNEWQELYTGFTRPNIPQEMAERNSRPYYQRMEYAREAPFAVLDDIGVRTATDGFRGDLHAVINHRVTNGLPTIYTSNLSLKEMENVFDARLYDRIRDQCGEIHFAGESKRGRR